MFGRKKIITVEQVLEEFPDYAIGYTNDYEGVSKAYPYVIYIRKISTNGIKIGLQRVSERGKDIMTEASINAVEAFMLIKNRLPDY